MLGCTLQSPHPHTTILCTTEFTDTLPGYHNVLKGNYTFYLLDKRHLTSEQANQHKLNLIEHFKKNVKPASAGRDKFKVSF